MNANPIDKRRRPLAVAIAACFVLTTFAAPCFAAYDNVTNCNDAGTGSLRDTVANAGEGDTVVLNPTNMQCSSITLSSGEIAVPRDNLTIKYNTTNGNRFSISGTYSLINFHARVFHHTGGGRLTLQRLDIKDGGFGTNIANTSVLGGCVDSAGVVDLEYSSVTGCSLGGASVGLGYFVRGGGVYAAQGLILNHSTIAYNQAANYYDTGTNYVGGQVEGAGAFAGRYIQANYSTISGNYALSVRYSSAGGGIFVDNRHTNHASTIEQCTISGNYARRGAGLLANNYGYAFTIQNSTISGNGQIKKSRSALDPGVIGAAIYSIGALTLRNSTVAFNKPMLYLAPPSAIFLAKSNYSVGIASSIIADNTENSYGNDVSSKFPITVSGAYNLIQSWGANVSFTFAPASGDPLLLPLADNGGPTLTHAFGKGSPAFGRGVRLDNPPTDQRGAGFPRQAADGAVDIGAYQEQIRDRIFSNGFD